MDVYRFLESHRIRFERFDHEAVFTVEEVKRLIPELPGAETKNLFVRDRKGKRHFLVVVGHDKSVGLKELGKQLGVSKLSFASPERLQKHLGVDPGSVTLLGVVNDPEHCVQVVVDRDLWGEEAIQCHPLVNTVTLVISTEDVAKIFSITGHEPLVMAVPERGEA